jgi:hypothetical protein
MSWQMVENGGSKVPKRELTCGDVARMQRNAARPDAPEANLDEAPPIEPVDVGDNHGLHTIRDRG